MATTKTSTKKHYIVTSPHGDWHYDPVEALGPEEAVRFSDSEAESADSLTNTYHVYELADPKPVVLEPEITLTRK